MKQRTSGRRSGPAREVVRRFSRHKPPQYGGALVALSKARELIHRILGHHDRVEGRYWWHAINDLMLTALGEQPIGVFMNVAPPDWSEVVLWKDKQRMVVGRWWWCTLQEMQEWSSSNPIAQGNMQGNIQRVLAFEDRHLFVHARLCFANGVVDDDGEMLRAYATKPFVWASRCVVHTQLVMYDTLVDVLVRYAMCRVLMNHVRYAGAPTSCCATSDSSRLRFLRRIKQHTCSGFSCHPARWQWPTSSSPS